MRDSAAARAAVPRLASIAGRTDAAPGPGAPGSGPDRGGASPVTTVLAGGTVVVSLHPAEVVTGDVVIDGDRIVAVGPPPAAAGAAGTAVIDCRGCLVIPGNVCAHTHAYSALARGMPYRLAPPRDFVEILRRVWWRLDRALDEESIRASARVAAMEALLAGTTTLVDHHASPDAIDGSLDILAEEFARLGVRSILAYETTDRDGPAHARAGLEENRRFLARVAATRPPLVRGLVGAHASFTLSDETLEACVDLARSQRSRAPRPRRRGRRRRARRGGRARAPVLARLERAGALDPAPVLAHGVHLDRAEAALFRASGATLVHNPRSNMNNAVGRAPLGLLGPRVALGTDGIGADMFEESRVGHLRHLEERAATNGPSARTIRPTPARSTGWPLARLAAGARLVGEAFDEPSLGRIVAGRAGRPRRPRLSGADAADLGHAGGALDVRALGAGGPRRHRRRPRRGPRPPADAPSTRTRSPPTPGPSAARLWERLDAIAEHPFVPGEVLVG